MRKLHAFLLVAVLSCLSACAAAQVNSALYSNSGYPPTDPQSVRILREFPDDGYIKLGEVSAAMPLTFAETDRTFEEKIRMETARIGGDAVVVREDVPFSTGRVQSTSTEQTYKDKKGHTHTTKTTENSEDEYGRHFYGIAIKFTQ